MEIFVEQRLNQFSIIFRNRVFLGMTVCYSPVSSSRNQTFGLVTRFNILKHLKQIVVVFITSYLTKDLKV